MRGHAALICPICTICTICTICIPAVVGGAAGVRAQDGRPRAKAFGIVRTADGRPWPGAMVHLFSRCVPSIEGAGGVDEIVVRSDGRGRFRAHVLTGRPYTTWARGVPRKGRYRVTGVVENVFPSVPVILREVGLAPVLRVAVHGLDAWRDHGPLRCRLVAETGNVLVRELALDAHGTGVAPPMPLEKVWLEVLGRDGFPVARRRIALAGKPGSTVSVSVPRPVSIGFVARDIATEKGLGGVELCRRMGGRLLGLGRTEQDGYARITVPADVLTPAGVRTLIVRRSGYGPGGVRRGPERKRSGAWPPIRGRAPIDLYTHLAAGKDTKARFLLGPERPAAGLPILVAGWGTHFETSNRRFSCTYRDVLHTDEQGRVTIPGAFSGYPAVVHAVLTERHLAALPRAWRARLHPVVHHVILPDGSGRERTVDLLELCPVDLAVTAADGAPAAHAVVTVLLAGTGHPGLLPDDLRDVIADRAGRVRLLLPPGDERTLSIRYRDSWTVGRLAVRRVAGDERPAQLRVRLREPRLVAGRVVDARGRALAGVDLRIYPYYLGNLSFPEDEATPQDLAGKGRNAAVLGALRDPRWFYAFAARVGLNVRVRTDAEGRFRFIVPAVPMTYRIYGARGRHRIDLQIQVEETSLPDLRIELPG